jgi:hypothetical protein
MEDNITNQQLVTLYDENPEVSIEMLAENFGYELEAIKMTLSASSVRYRKEMKKDETTFTDDDYEVAKKTMCRLMNAEVEAVALRAATFVINEHKGRHNLENHKNLGTNINIINVHVQKARQALAMSKAQKPVVDINSMKQLREVEVAA